MPEQKSHINDIIGDNRLLEILNDKVRSSSFYNEDLFNKIADYTTAYLEFAENAPITADKAYFKFIKSYNKDMKRFAETDKYPLELDADRKAPSRFEYDIILLFSCLFAAHRFRIMQLIDNKTAPINNGLFIGCGPGLEIELVKSRIEKLVAYDFSLNKFPVQKHPKAVFVEEYFDGTNSKEKYEGIYLIELLEHLDKPYQLLEQCKNVLSDDGKIFLTTATNIPQFDHLYNFEPNHEDFEKRVVDMGYTIDFMEDIPHEGLTLNINAKNRFYVLKYNG